MPGMSLNDDDFLDKDEFLALCELKVLTDWDGYALYSREGRIFDHERVLPSEVLKKGFNSEFTHVVWHAHNDH